MRKHLKMKSEAKPEATGKPMPVVQRRLVRPLWRACCDGRYSECGSRDLHELDWSNWWEDNGYIHVRACPVFNDGEGETWHRVCPKPVKNRPRMRLGVRAGRPFWILDGPNAGSLLPRTPEMTDHD